jgi:hypothetical protein
MHIMIKTRIHLHICVSSTYGLHVCLQHMASIGDREKPMVLKNEIAYQRMTVQNQWFEVEGGVIQALC